MHPIGDPFQLAVAQSPSLAGDVAANLHTIEAQCAQAQAQGADLILFPECHASGYSYRDLAALTAATADPLSGRIARRLSELAQRHDLVVCCGMFEREGDLIFNTHVVAFPDGRLDRQRKGITEGIESVVISLDRTRRVFEWNGLRFGILICADSALQDHPEQFSALQVTLLLHPCAGRILSIGPDAQAALQKEADAGFQTGCTLAQTLDVTYAAANPIGFSGEDYYPGNSWIVRPDGRHARLIATSLPGEMLPSLAVAPALKRSDKPAADLAPASDFTFREPCVTAPGF